MKCPKCGFDTPPTQIRKAGMCRTCERRNRIEAIALEAENEDD